MVESDLHAAEQERESLQRKVELLETALESPGSRLALRRILERYTVCLVDSCTHLYIVHLLHAADINLCVCTPQQSWYNTMKGETFNLAAILHPPTCTYICIVAYSKLRLMMPCIHHK